MAAEQDRIQDLIERIAGDIMTANRQDLSSVGSICTSLEQIVQAMQETQPVSANLAAALNTVLEKVILDECGDVNDPLDMVAQGIALLQRV